MRFVEGRSDQSGCFIIAPRPRQQQICNSCEPTLLRRKSGHRFRSRTYSSHLVSFLALFLVVVFCSVVVVEGHKHELIFPSNDEYDPMAFHPDTAIAFGSGAPYGGYSRASRSRLAKLPIRLVGEAQFESVNRGRSSTMDSTMVAEEEDEPSSAITDSTDEDTLEENEEEIIDGEYYFYIRDGEGRLFACAVHHEDDVHSQSLEESVFDDVILAGEEPPLPSSSHTKNDNDAAPVTTQGKTSTASGNTNQMDEITRLVNSAMAGDGVVFGNMGDVLGGLDNNNDIGNVVAEMIHDALENEGIVGDALEGVQIDIEQLDIDVLTGEDGEFDPDDENGLANIISNALQQRAAEQQQRGGGGGGRGGQQQLRLGGAGGVGAGGPLVGGIVIGGGGKGTGGGNGNGNKGGGGDAINVGINMKEMDRISQQLQGVCAQVHQGYWSYEWCHKKAVKQFHVTAKANKEKPGQFHYNIDTVIRLGKYQSELPKMSFMNGYGLNDIIHGNTGGTSDPITIAAPKGKESSSKTTDWASVKLVQTYENGDKCAEAGGKRRSVTTELRCCTQEEQAAMKEEEREEEEKENAEQTKGGASSSSSSFSLTSKTLARLIKVEEHKTNVCTYTATVCTPLLCSDDVIQMEEGTMTTKQESSGNAAVADILKKFGMNDIASVINDAVADATAASSSSSSSGDSMRSSSSSSSSSSVIPATAMLDVNQSIRQLLKTTLGHKCLQKNDGWWRYELCHTKRVRQFHAGTKIDPVTGNTQMVVETEHLLGLYNHTSTSTSLSNINNNKKTARNQAQHVSEEDNSMNDLLFPLDYPDSEEIEHMEHPKTSLATFTMEYTGGDMCDNSDDVKDESLKQVARATTVKFSCGKTYELKRVNEDSTCHYVFHVSVPDLCRHPLFVAPVVKEQIIKCLPVVHDMILDDE